jgi:hypothetical protein
MTASWAEDLLLVRRSTIASSAFFENWLGWTDSMCLTLFDSELIGLAKYGRSY